MAVGSTALQVEDPLPMRVIGEVSSYSARALQSLTLLPHNVFAVYSNDWAANGGSSKHNDGRAVPQSSDVSFFFSCFVPREKAFSDKHRCYTTAPWTRCASSSHPFLSMSNLASRGVVWCGSFFGFFAQLASYIVLSVHTGWSTKECFV